MDGRARFGVTWGDDVKVLPAEREYKAAVAAGDRLSMGPSCGGSAAADVSSKGRTGLSDAPGSRIRNTAWCRLFGVILWAAMALWAVPARGAEGLPEDCPVDLYDPAAVAPFERVTDRDVQLLPGLPLRQVQLRTRLAYISGPNAIRQPETVLYSFLREPVRERIVAIVQTLIQMMDETRSVRVWVDRGWRDEGYASGVWDTLLRPSFSPPMAESDATAALRPLREAVKGGLIKSAERRPAGGGER